MAEQNDIAEGFCKIEEKHLSKTPPQIKWGEIYKKWTDKQKIEYLEKFARSMNHAASMLQDERDELNKLCERKEQQINSLNEALSQNNNMIQSQMSRMNEDKQKTLQTVADLNKRIKELENGTKH